MTRLLHWWEARCAESRLLRFVDINLRGVGQVVFQDNPLSGALFVIAILWGSVAGGVPQVAGGGIVAVIVATLTAQWLRVDGASLRAGLYGFNGFLAGLALPTFLAPGPLLWAYVILAGAASVVAMLAIVALVKPWGLPALTFPFVLVTWIFLLASHGFSGIDGAGLPLGGIVGAAAPVASDPLHIIDFLGGVLRSVSQVFLKGSVVASVLLLAGIAVGSVPAALCAIGGALIAVVVAHLFGVESGLVTAGLLGFSPVLTSVALGAVFHRPGKRVLIYAAAGTVFTVIAQAAFNAGMTPFAIPSLTAPFVLATWLFLLPRLPLEPGADGSG